jgi:hypothetical protein
MTSTGPISLASAIGDLRDELLRAVQNGAGKPLQFHLKPIEMEFKLAITRSDEAHGGVKFWVIDAGAKGSYENALTHTIKLTLEPVGSDGRTEVNVSAQDDELE